MNNRDFREGGIINWDKKRIFGEKRNVTSVCVQ